MSEIDLRMNRSKSPISRELSRNPLHFKFESANAIGRKTTIKLKYDAEADTIFLSTDNNYYPNGQNISDRVDERHIG